MVPNMEKRTRVMVVDDHPMWRRGIVRDLADSPYEVVAEAGDGAQALRLAAAARLDLVVLDLHLPDLRGVEVIGGLLAVNPDIRILILSASGEHQDVLDAVKAGATGYLLKSASAAEFREALDRTVLGGADSARDRGAAARRIRALLQADRAAAHALAPDRAEPRAEHAQQTPAAQPCRARALRDQPRA
jgi:DNA-binding NarL/FixJ family response regulator